MTHFSLHGIIWVCLFPAVDSCSCCLMVEEVSPNYITCCLYGGEESPTSKMRVLPWQVSLWQNTPLPVGNKEIFMSWALWRLDHTCQCPGCTASLGVRWEPGVWWRRVCLLAVYGQQCLSSPPCSFWQTCLVLSSGHPLSPADEWVYQGHILLLGWEAEMPCLCPCFQLFLLTFRM